MLKDFADSLLLKAINRVLATQPAIRDRLQRHQGKSVRIDLPLAGLIFLVTESGDLAPAEIVEEVTTHIRLDAMTLARLAWGDRAGLKQAQIQGDGLLASDLSAALDQLDWALALRPWVGDMAAARVDQARAEFIKARTQAHNAVGHSLSEYAVYEAGLLADRHALDQFAANVDKLREDTDRLAARLALLETRKTD